MEMAVADFPLLGMRTRMIVSVLVDTSSPARSVASSSADSGLPWASVRLSIPTSRMSMAPSSPPPPSADGADVVDARFERADLAPRHAGADDDDRRRDDGDDAGETTVHQPRLLARRPQTG